MTEVGAKMRELSRKNAFALQKLVEPARAAANAMKDAGLNRTADPLLQALFELDAVVAEMKDLCSSNFADVVKELLGP